MERELLMTGIGGQGVQLAAQVMARAAIRFGRYVQLFGSYGGMMRGGNTDATLIIGRSRCRRPRWSDPPGRRWSCTTSSLRPTLARLQPRRRPRAQHERRTTGTIPPCPASVHTAQIPASELAIELGSAAAATWWRSAAYAAATGMLAIEELVERCPKRCRSYRQQHVASNERALQRRCRGRARSTGFAPPAWPSATQVAHERRPGADPGHRGHRRRGVQGLRPVHRRLPAAGAGDDRARASTRGLPLPAAARRLHRLQGVLADLPRLRASRSTGTTSRSSSSVDRP